MPAKKQQIDSKKQHSATPKQAGKKESSHTSEKKKHAFPIVGMGASAGGLEAFETFFRHMPQDPGMAFVLVSHLDPTHSSIMPELIQKHTPMKVVQAEDDMTVKKDQVYVIPPDKDMSVKNARLRLTKPTMQQGPRAPVNFFLRSLAEDQGDMAIAIIFSGMGMDGTEGIKAVKAALGIVMVQDLTTCKYGSMPKNAIATGLADYVLPPEEMGQALKAYMRRSIQRPAVTAPSPERVPESSLRKIHMRLRSATGHDFSGYKESTIVRRIQRRMDVHQIDAFPNYITYMDQNEMEAKALFKELLIGVTGFFRENAAFEALKEKALPELFENKPGNYTIRAWVPGCATGEEAYSLAMVMRECMNKLKKELSVQIFATDIDEQAIEKARAGVYPGDISADVSADRLEAFFHRMDDSYQINTGIREMLVFAPQSIIKDPPFTRMDIICCRNLLIYLQSDLQKKLLPMFHYSLRPGGILFLGSSESVGEFADLYTLVDSKWKIYRHKQTDTGVYPVIDLEFGPQAMHEQSPKREMPPAHEISQIVQRHLMVYHTPPSVVIDHKGDIAYIHGRTGKYLEPAAGSSRKNNILEMAREGLRTRLPAMVRSAVKEKRKVQDNLHIQQNGEVLAVDVTVKPLNEPGVKGLYVVLFEDTPLTEEKKAERNPPATGGEDRIRHLEAELRHTKENLQTTIEELETSNEKLRSINEEYQSANEELQSANEELNSSKEELQSLNEELETVNAQLQGKNMELLNANDDMTNLLDSVEIPTIFLDNQLCIKRFTSHVDKLVNLRESDVGRPISDLVNRLRQGDLIAEAKQVLLSLVPTEFETLSMDDRWYQVKIRPYRSADNAIEGLVLSFVDIHEQKSAALYVEAIVDTVREPLVVLDQDLHVKRANRSFYSSFQVTAEETEGRNLYDLGIGQWDIPELRHMLEQIIPESRFFEGFIVEREFSKIGKKKMVLNARGIAQAGGRPDSILLAIEDVTDS